MREKTEAGTEPVKFKKKNIYIYIYRQVKVLSSQQRISPEGSQTDSQPKLEGQILYTVKEEQALSNF